MVRFVTTMQHRYELLYVSIYAKKFNYILHSLNVIIINACHVKWHLMPSYVREMLVNIITIIRRCR